MRAKIVREWNYFTADTAYNVTCQVNNKIPHYWKKIHKTLGSWLSPFSSDTYVGWSKAFEIFINAGETNMNALKESSFTILVHDMIGVNDVNIKRHN